MNRIEHEISFGIPSNVDLETFTAFPQVEINESAFGGDDVRTGEGLVKKLSEVNMIRNQIVLNGSSFGVEEWQKQVEYDRFMNEIWIGVVLSLIVISMVFCICSCFLYHQFRHWKQNYRNTIRENQDIESMKLSPEDDDPVPSYTLVSGLPSYDAAIEQFQKSTDKNIATYPSVFKIFTTLEKTPMDCSSEKPWRELITISNCEESAANQTGAGECEKALMGGLTC